jgi:hypothetical protein
MTDPQDPQNGRAKYRFSAVPPSSIYTFSHVFLPSTTQYDFFTKTTLPLVQDVLTGQNGLLFTYGVTNSGKTYTVQGGTQEGTAGILPRSLDVIFNSIEGLHGDGRVRDIFPPLCGKLTLSSSIDQFVCMVLNSQMIWTPRNPLQCPSLLLLTFLDR